MAFWRSLCWCPSRRVSATPLASASRQPPWSLPRPSSLPGIFSSCERRCMCWSGHAAVWPCQPHAAAPACVPVAAATAPSFCKPLCAPQHSRAGLPPGLQHDSSGVHRAFLPLQVHLCAARRLCLLPHLPRPACCVGQPQGATAVGGRPVWCVNVLGGAPGCWRPPRQRMRVAAQLVTPHAAGGRVVLQQVA